MDYLFVIAIVLDPSTFALVRVLPNMACKSKKTGRVSVSPFVSITLYGKAWSEKDLERAERNERFVVGDTGFAEQVAEQIASDLHTWVSIRGLKKLDKIASREFYLGKFALQQPRVWDPPYMPTRVLN